LLSERDPVEIKTNAKIVTPDFSRKAILKVLVSREAIERFIYLNAAPRRF